MAKVDSSKLSKLYYSISEVAELFDVNMSLIRFWEKEFPNLQPKKNKRGNRYYSPKEIEKFDRIYTLVKLEGYTLDGAKKALKSRQKTAFVDEGNSQTHIAENDVLSKLESIKLKLIELRNKL